jgi:hypothetical protein
MSKFREAMKAGQLAYRGPGNKSQLIELGYAYARRSVISAIASIIIWWIIAPIFSWFWFRWRQST